MQIVLKSILLLLLCLTAQLAIAQQSQAIQQPTDTLPEGRRIKILFADTTRILQSKENNIQKLIGNVRLRQDSVFMRCDSAILINELRVRAYGNVVLQQADTINVFSDTLLYDGLTKTARLSGEEVILQNGTQELFTNRLDYDLTQKVATYHNKAVIFNDSTQLSSTHGYYYVDEEAVYFQDSVVVIDEGFTLRADTLKFNVATKVVDFLGPTRIKSDSSLIYCEGGFYDTENGLAEFTGNAQFLKNDQKGTARKMIYDDNAKTYLLDGNAMVEDSIRKATGDLIRYQELEEKIFIQGNARFRDKEQNIVADEILYDGETGTYATRGRSFISDESNILEADQVDYDDETGMGLATGNVVWRDTSANITVNTSRADYIKEQDYLKAVGGPRGRPELITMMEGDSLFMASDTLLGVRGDTLEQDTSRLLKAFYDVRIFKSNLQGRCDSIVYNTTDSLFTMYGSPVIWTDTSQFTADTIRIQMRNESINRIYLRSNAFIVNLADDLFYNQIKGKNIVAYFSNEELYKMDVSGNAETIYYAKDDENTYVGVNKTACSNMVIYFGSNEVERIKFFTEPQSTLTPMDSADHDSLRLKGFKWIEEGRPQSRDDLFVVSKTSERYE